jgi:hypothetical protein
VEACTEVRDPRPANPANVVALLRWVIPGSAGALACGPVRLSQRARRGLCGAGDLRDVGGDVVVAAAQILHKRMTGGQDPC